MATVALSKLASVARTLTAPTDVTYNRKVIGTYYPAGTKQPPVEIREELRKPHQVTATTTEAFVAEVRAAQQRRDNWLGRINARKK